MRVVKDSLAAPLKEKRASLEGSFGGMIVVRRAQLVTQPGLLGDNRQERMMSKTTTTRYKVARLYSAHRSFAQNQP